MDFAELLRHPESKTLEFKRDLSSPDGVLKTIVAFANTAGGVLLIGVADTRAILGVPDPLRTEERLANLVSDLVEPRLVPEIELLPWRKTQVIAVRVHPSAIRPHYLRREGRNRGVYVRVGSTNRRADAELIGELSRFVRFETFDALPLPELGSEALDFRAASELFEHKRRLSPRDLETLRLLVDYQGRKVPTVAGVLIVGAEGVIDRQFPDAWLQAGRFAGTDKARIIDHVALRGPLVTLIEQGIAFVHRHLQLAADIGNVRRSDRMELPPLAVREAVINAVVHADYAQRGAPIRIAVFDDRLEVENPGLLPFGLTIDDLRQGVSKLRNRVIARVFNELGLIEQWGSGVQRMLATCAEAGLAPPEFEELGLRFRVTLRKAPVGVPQVDAVERAILELVADPQGRSTAQIADVIGLTPRATRTRLAALVARGLLQVIGSGPRDPQRRYVRMAGAGR